jgi:hypothetical protein
MKYLKNRYFNIFYISLLLSTEICNLSCTKIIQQYPIAHIPQVLKEYTLFRPGSYWTYKDSISGKEFTSTVTGLKLDSFLDASYMIVTAEVDYNVPNNPEPYSSYSVQYGTYSFNAQNLSYGSINVGYIMVYPFDLPYIVEKPLETYPVFTYDTLKFISKIYNYPINGFIFPEVVKFEDTKEPVDNSGDGVGQRAYHFYARGAGLIQVQLIDSSKNYKLISYHLN